MIKNMCSNRAPRNHLNQCIYDTCSSRKRSALDVLFELLGHDPILSRNSDADGNHSGERTNEVAVVQRSWLINTSAKHELGMCSLGTWLDMKLQLDKNNTKERGFYVPMFIGGRTLEGSMES